MNKFIEDLASSRPTPGGGAAAAVAGAMAAALVEMVARLTPGMTADETLRKRLLELADEDCRAFDAVMATYKKKLGIREALEWAMRVPQETMGAAAEVEKLALEMVEKGNKNAISDAKSAVYLSQAAQKMAKGNVEINRVVLEKLRRVR